MERSIEEVVRVIERSPCGDAQQISLPDSAKSAFRLHYFQRMYEVGTYLLGNTLRAFCISLSVKGVCFLSNPRGHT